MLATLFISNLAHASSLEQGIALYQRENNDEAELALKQARQEDPSSTRAAFYLGLTYKRLQRYRESKENLLFAVNNEPKIKEAVLELVEVLYQLGDYAEAEKWVAVAEREGIRPAQTAFLKGLILVKREKNEEAAQSFGKAKELDGALRQPADYQLGMLKLKSQDYTGAADSFKEVLTLDPNTDIGAYAREYVKAIENRGGAARDWKLNLGFFEEYDDNVVLNPSDSTSVQTVGSADDWREVATVNAEWGHRYTERFGFKLNYDLYFALQNEQHAFDVNSHTVGGAPTWYWEKWSLSVPVSYNYTWVDDDDFLATFSVGPVASIRTGENDLTQLSLRFQDKSFMNDVTLAAENRDAVRVAPGVSWFRFFMENQGFFGGRYEFDSEDTDGRNWRYDGHRFNVSLQYPFTERLKMTLAAEYYRQRFDNVHTIFNVARQDSTYTYSALLTYDLTKQLELQVRYTHVDHESNIFIYEYDRNVISTGVVYRF